MCKEQLNEFKIKFNNICNSNEDKIYLNENILLLKHKFDYLNKLKQRLSVDKIKQNHLNALIVSQNKLKLNENMHYFYQQLISIKKGIHSVYVFDTRTIIIEDLLLPGLKFLNIFLNFFFKDCTKSKEYEIKSVDLIDNRLMFVLIYQASLCVQFIMTLNDNK